MGDYNRVQSYIKSHVLPKLDSLPDDVASVKNAFDAWKADWTQARAIKLDNLDTKVSTRATAADMGTALERVEALQVSLQSVTERVATIEKEVQHEALSQAMKGVFMNFYNPTTTKPVVLSVYGAGTLYLANMSTNINGIKLSVVLDNNTVNIIGKSTSNHTIGICTEEAFYEDRDIPGDYGSQSEQRLAEVPGVPESFGGVRKIDTLVNGVNKIFYWFSKQRFITLEEELFSSKELSLSTYSDCSFGRYKGYRFEKSLKIYLDYSDVSDLRRSTSVLAMYRLEG